MPNSPREAAAALRNGNTERIDVGRVAFQDFSGKTAERFFLNVSSLGLAASIIERVKRQNRVFDWLPVQALRGQANFAASTLAGILEVAPFTVRVSIDSEAETTLQTINFCVANARYFGGGMMVAPDAKLSDGLLDVVNIGDLSTATILARGYTLYRGTHLSLQNVGSRTARRIEVWPLNPGEEVRIETDGELPGRLPAVWEVVPAALRLRVPRKPAK
jgi:diacylglycerol kinase family enzyme